MPPTGFDDVYAVSDLHMGGRPGTQVFKCPDRLGSLLTKLAQGPTDREIAFVLNGDVIDSLAEGLRGYVAMTQREIDRLLDDVFANFKSVWDGMATFACSPKRHLVITIGNHDIELGMRQVQERIKTRLAEGNVQGPSVTFSTEGEGFTCMVGDSQVHCTHGNEYDDWNRVDYEQLRKLGAYIENRDIFPPRDWKPNAGTRLVVDVMNLIKDRYAFVDLLKPEKKPVLAVLLTLKPELLKKQSMTDAAAIGISYVRGALKRRGLLSTDAEGVEQILDDRKSAEAAKDELFGPRMSAAIKNTNVDSILLGLEYDVRAGQRASALVEAESAGETLGFIKMLVDRIKRVDKVDSLREALLDWIGDDDKTFSLNYEDDVCKGIKKDTTKKQHNFIIAGHTHLERAIRLDEQRFYYNSGTWIRLLRLPKDLLQSGSEFRRVYAALDRGTLDDLDSLKVDYANKKGQPVILDCAAVVHIAREGAQTVGRLCRVTGTGETVQWSPLANTEFRK